MTTETHSHDGAGFSRLADLIPATVAIARGGVRAVWSVHELEARIGMPGLADRLIELLTAPDIHSSSGEAKRGFGGDVKGSLGSLETQNAFTKFNSASAFGEVGVGSRDGGAGGRDEGEGEGASQAGDNHRTADDIERIAAHLASALRDEKSIVFFRLVARAVPREVIRDALTRALDAQSVHRSRSALFVHLVRRYLPQRPSTNLTNPS